MLPQNFASCVKDRLERCRAHLDRVERVRDDSVKRFVEIEQELIALEGEAQLFEFSSLLPLISATAGHLDEGDPMSSVLRARRGFDSIHLMMRMRDDGEKTQRAVELLVPYIGGSTEFPGEIERSLARSQTENKRILIIDDSEITREMIEISLEDEGHDVIGMGDMKTFGRVFRSFSPDIILTDVNMPDAQGDHICRALKSKYDTANIPIILFSSLDEKQLAALAERAGADGYVSKQNGLSTLVKQITELIDLMIW